VSTQRFRIVHQTVLNYPRPVAHSHNEVRMTPVTEDGQLTLESRLRVKPMSWSHVYRDYWGTHVTAIESLERHLVLEIESLSTVERTLTPSQRTGNGWAEYRLEQVLDQFYDYLTPGARTVLAPAVIAGWQEEARSLLPAEAVAHICRAVHDHVTYEPGTSHVADGAAEAWENRRGVCQDLAHVAIAGIRGLGIPARYVSGYLCPVADLPVGDTASGESHAWVEWWDGAWVGADPTNLRDVGCDHIIVARGRDYDDVPPMRGVYQGPREAALSVTVTFRRLS